MLGVELLDEFGEILVLEHVVDLLAEEVGAQEALQQIDIDRWHSQVRVGVRVGDDDQRVKVALDCVEALHHFLGVLLDLL